MRSKSIHLKGVSKSFGQFVAVHPLDMTIRAGEFITLLGPSGCGKTTILRMIAGLESVSEGEIVLDDEVVTEIPPNRRDVAIMFQDYALFPHMSVRDNVAYGLKMQSVPRGVRYRRVDDWLARMELSQQAGRRPAGLSGGQRQRAALARALITEPAALLLDEPLSALDANLRAQLRDELRRIHKEVGTTFVCVTHDQDEAMTLSDRIAVMQNGRVEQIGTPDQIYDYPANQFVTEFFGKCGLWDAIVTDAVKALCRVTGVQGETPFMSHAKVSEGEAIRIVLRPEALKLAAPDDGDAWVAGRLTEATTAGGFHALTMRTDAGETAFVSLPRSGEALPEPGAQVRLALRVDRLPAILARGPG